MSNTQFEYRLTPDEVKANSRVNFTLSISNPNQLVAVKQGNAFNYLSPTRMRAKAALGDEIDMFWNIGNAPDDFAVNLDAVTAVSLSEGWQIAISPSSAGPFFKIFPTGDGEIPPGRSISFSINNVVTNPYAGPTLVEYLEFIDGNEGQTQQTIVKNPQTLSITAQLLPPIVGLNQPTRLQWTVTGGAFVNIVGWDGNQPLNVDRPVNGNPFTDSLMVTPAPRQTIYSLTVRTVTGETAQATPNPVATVSPPIIFFFEPQDLPPIAINEQVTLRWNVQFATTVFLSIPQPVRVNPEDSRVFTPKDLLLGNESEVFYYLRAEGYEGPEEDKVKITFQPVKAFYYRYRTPAKQFTEWDGVNYLRFQETKEGDVRTLTLTGPGGPIVLHLGPGPWLQIPLFYAEPPEITAGETTMLHWETANAISLVLEPGGIVIGEDQIQEGHLEVSPGETTDYTLVATDREGGQLTSLLRVEVRPAAGKACF